MPCPLDRGHNVAVQEDRSAESLRLHGVSLKHWALSDSMRHVALSEQTSACKRYRCLQYKALLASPVKMQEFCCKGATAAADWVVNQGKRDCCFPIQIHKQESVTKKLITA